MRYLLLLLVIPVCGQTFHADPERIKQGQVIKVTAGSEITSARMDGRTIALFAQANGEEMGLMPVPVLTKPGAYPLEFLDAKGVVAKTVSVSVVDAHFHRENISIAPSIAGLKPSPGEQKTVGEFERVVSPVRFWTEPFQAPVPGCVTSPFGSLRMHNGKLTGSFHGGVDQRGSAGTPIHPMTAGVVKLVEKYNLRGGTVAIDHGQGLETIYLHMSDFNAKEGQQVSPADTIGYVGSTGRSTGPHVHWTIYVHGEAMNPAQWMSLEACTSPAPEPAKKKAISTKP